MMKPDIQENLMRRYLLGDLPESEIERARDPDLARR